MIDMMICIVSDIAPTMKLGELGIHNKSRLQAAHRKWLHGEWGSP